MALRSKKFEIGDKVEYEGQPATVVADGLKPKMGHVNIRNNFGYVVMVKEKDLKEPRE